MKKLFNDNWLFAKTKPDQTPDEADFKKVLLPHDWLIEQTYDLYETSYGHYKKSISVEDAADKSIRLYFEGVYMDSTVYCNGERVCDNPYGYSSFEADLTPYVHDGENEIYVLVRHMSPNSRWYSGAGIYRNVWLYETEKSYIVTDSLYVHAEPLVDERTDCDTLTYYDRWAVILSTEMNIEAGHILSKLSSNVDKDGYVLFVSIKSKEKLLYSEEACITDGKTEFSFTLNDITKDDIWDIDSPNPLTVELTLSRDGKILDTLTQTTGLRSIRYDENKGFFLNGRHIKLNGVCLHHDLGCLGAAYDQTAARRQLLAMKEMGANAIRTSHNMPSVGFMELCDELGFLVDSDAFDIWELKKTEYDYARFFDDWYEKDVASWIRRDRNHPSVIMWSVGNEIYDTHASDRGREVARLLHEAVRRHDPLKNAPTTIASNYMQWEGAKNCASEVDIQGYNYGESLYYDHHKEHPEWCIYGSETTSGVKSRGIYHFPRSEAFLTHEDLQCSSLGNCLSGKTEITADKVIAINRDTDYCAGMFIWTGADYIGESTPYTTKNAYFGCIDTAGLKKDIFWLYKAAWGGEDVIHLLPYWDFNEGQLIDVVCYTNAESVELFVNGSSAGIVKVHDYIATWNVSYNEGTIEVIGTTSDGRRLKDSRTTFKDTDTLDIKLDPASNDDLAFYEIGAIDEDGHPVLNARDRVNVTIEGGCLAGFDNGDSTDYDSYKSSSRRLFSGKAVAYVRPDSKLSDVKFNATIDKTDIPIRKLELTRNSGMTVSPETGDVEFVAHIYPENATYKSLRWSVITDCGIISNKAEIIAEKSSDIVQHARLNIHGDGAFRVRVTADNGRSNSEVISEYEFVSEGFGTVTINPYEKVAAGLYNESLFPLDQVREGGVNVMGDNNIVGFHRVDFGKYGADEFSISLINWFKNDPVNFALWSGYPKKDGSTKLGSFSHQKEFIWQTYQSETYKLSETIKGEQDIFFEFETGDFRIDFGGFKFLPRVKAYERLNITDCDLIRGDTYTIDGDIVRGIGNNVFMDFKELDFTHGSRTLTLKGRTRHDHDSVHIYFADEEGVKYKEIVEFSKSEEMTSETIAIPDLHGVMTVELIFLPGSDFDFESFIIR